MPSALSKTARFRQVAYELEHIGKPLAHALGRLTPEHLRQARVGVGGKLTVRYFPL